MGHHPSSWPSERPEELTNLLREQKASREECSDLLSALLRLSEWQAPQPEPADTQHLIAVLAPELPTLSPVRQAIREYRQHRVARLLTTARTQVSLFRPGFWLVSALITLLGAGVVFSNVISDQALVLRICGPLLAFLGTIIAFRGREARVLELELVCLPTPLQLALIRLVIVLGYDVGLGLALSFALWAGGSGQVLTLTLAWLMPLLLVAGLALLLTLRFPVQTAVSLAYGSWLAFLAIETLTRLSFAPALTVLPGGIGVVLFIIALLCLHAKAHRLLPHLSDGRTFWGTNS